MHHGADWGSCSAAFQEYTEDAGIINVFTIGGEGIDIDQGELEYEMKLKLMEMAEENMLKWQRILEDLQKGEEFE